MKHLTIVYYQKPDAKPHIEFWRKEMQNEIKSLETYKSDFIFTLYKGEVVYITPINDPQISNIQKLQKEQKLTYLKTLIFGKVNQRQLQDITVNIKLFENGKR